jgi:hypothetical protein
MYVSKGNMATVADACPHLRYDRTGRAYKCRECGMPLVLHTVPMTLQQVTQFEKMRRSQDSAVRRAGSTGLVVPKGATIESRGEK